eukprot:199313-Alexandrium_andersonii.AAC.1
MRGPQRCPSTCRRCTAARRRNCRTSNKASRTPATAVPNEAAQPRRPEGAEADGDEHHAPRASRPARATSDPTAPPFSSS